MATSSTIQTIRTRSQRSSDPPQPAEPQGGPDPEQLDRGRGEMDRDVRVGIDQEVHLGEGQDQALPHQPAGELGLAPRPPGKAAGQAHLPDMDLLAPEEPLQIGGQRGRGGIALAGALLQALQADVLELAGNRGAELARRHRVALEHLRQRLGHGRRPGTGDGPVKSW